MRMVLLGLSLLFSVSGCGEGVGAGPLEESARHQALLGQGVVRLRVMTANLTAGNHQSYDTGEGKRIFQGLRPDVALIQELNVGAGSSAEVRQFIDEAFGADFFYFRETGAQLPNAVVSRFPLLAAGQWNDPHIANRDFVWARIDLPGPRELVAISVHLSASSSATRAAQARTLVALVQGQVHLDDYLVVGGDLNTGSGQVLAELDRVVRTKGAPPADAKGNSNTNATRKKRLDWVLSDSDLEAFHEPLVVADQTFPSGLVFDSRAFDPLPLVAPVQRSDSGARNMQHMAVMRAFGLPSAAPRQSN